MKDPSLGIGVESQTVPVLPGRIRAERKQERDFDSESLSRVDHQSNMGVSISKVSYAILLRLSPVGPCT